MGCTSNTSASAAGPKKMSKEDPKSKGGQDAFTKVAQDSVEKIWATYDADNNGTLDHAEMSKFVKTTMDEIRVHHTDCAEPTEEEINEAVKQYDANKDGKIEKTEMLGFMTKMLKKEETKMEKTDEPQVKKV